MFAAPMIVMYVLGIGIAWLAKPKSDARGSVDQDAVLGLVVAASVFER